MPIGTIQEGSNRAHLGFWASHLNFLAIQQQQGPHQNLLPSSMHRSGKLSGDVWLRVTVLYILCHGFL